MGCERVPEARSCQADPNNNAFAWWIRPDSLDTLRNQAHVPTSTLL